MPHAGHFPIRFEPWFAVLARALFLPPSASCVSVTDQGVEVRMGWAFRARFDRAHVASASRYGETIAWTRGVHGFAGRWLVNGAGDGLVAIDLDPPQRAYVMGVPVKLRQLLVSAEDPDALVAALQS